MVSKLGVEKDARFENVKKVEVGLVSRFSTRCMLGFGDRSGSDEVT
jgi:hypothetical protein